MKIAFSTPVQKISAIGIMAAILFSCITVAYYYGSVQHTKGQAASQTEKNANNTPRQQLRGAYAKLDSLSEELAVQIETASVLGENTDSLQAFRKLLEAEKYHLKLIRNVDSLQIADMSHKINHYEQLLEKKNAELEILQETIDELKEENKVLRSEKENLKEKAADACTQKEVLEAKLNIAKRLIAENFEIQGFDKGESKHTENHLLAKKINKLAIRFQIRKNILVDPAEKKLYIRIVEPNNMVLFDQKNPPHHFRLQGREEFCTSIKAIRYEATDTPVSYVFEKGNLFKAGKHKVEIYCEDYLIGEHFFTIQ